MTGMECTCSIDAYDNDEEQWGCEMRNVRARKRYQCVECDSIIAVGDVHEVASGNYGGDWYRYRTCLPCASIRQAHCCSWVWGDLRETLIEVMGMDYVTGRLTAWGERMEADEGES